MDLKHARYFIAVAENLHFGRAAERMNVVQSAVSQQIKRLEDELQTVLFERIGSEIRLTESGAQLLPECRKLLRQAEETVRVAREAGVGARGKITLGLVDNVICSLLPPLARSFTAQHPNVELRLEPASRLKQLEALRERFIDVGLMPSPLPKDEFASEPYLSGPLIAAIPATHRLAALSTIPLASLATEPFILFPAQNRTRILEIILEACAAQSFTPRVAQEASQMHTVLALVDAGLGVTLVPPWIAQFESHNVAFRPIDPPTATYELLLVWRHDTSNKAIPGLVRVAREEVAKRSYQN